MHGSNIHELALGTQVHFCLCKEQQQLMHEQHEEDACCIFTTWEGSPLGEQRASQVLLFMQVQWLACSTSEASLLQASIIIQLSCLLWRGQGKAKGVDWSGQGE